LNFQHGEQKIPRNVSALHKSLAKALNRTPKRIRLALFPLFAKERKKLTRRLLHVALALTTLSLTLFSFHSILGQANQTLSIGSQGTIETVGVGVYWDSNCSNRVSYVEWGTVEPGSIKNVAIYVRNEGNFPVHLFMLPDNWNPPEASNYMTLSWNYASQTVNPKEVIQTTLTLSTSSGIEGITNFSFDIIIYVSW